MKPFQEWRFIIIYTKLSDEADGGIYFRRNERPVNGLFEQVSLGIEPTPELFYQKNIFVWDLSVSHTNCKLAFPFVLTKRVGATISLLRRTIGLLEGRIGIAGFRSVLNLQEAYMIKFTQDEIRYHWK